ncbi:MAG: Aspartate carbamoyltransferase [uncultured Frankineae bacterium]|uniref:Aspartate carbamoyltransferase n=1 Tax=uncultured Frankineae bacterium TaxID=437475 RepID=A0A6J4M7M7_9ACTN|nr:MAG: Aspartate carbamoyltransferase [uncultured Frankineae bacterium]
MRTATRGPATPPAATRSPSGGDPAAAGTATPGTAAPDTPAQDTATRDTASAGAGNADGTDPRPMGRHLLSAADLSLDEATLVLDTAEELARVSQAATVKKLPTLRGRTVVNLFFEDSTRTRTSFELAAKRLSADVINFSAKGSSVSKGETLKDTALTLEAMGSDAVVCRHSWSGAPANLARWVRGSVVNAGDGTHEHPTQALLDAYTMRQRLGRVEGLKVTIVGDVLHSRVARSNVLLLHTLGADVTLVAPPTLLPVGVGAWPAAVSYDLDAVLPTSDVVMMLRVQRERMGPAGERGTAYFPSAREYARRYGLDVRRAQALPDRAVVMHPGPMVRGMEISPEVADGVRSTIQEQVANGVSVRMAVLYLLLGGAQPAIGSVPSEPGRRGLS